MDIADLVAKYSDEVVELRRDFHQHPELGLEEHRTSEKVVSYLKNCGLEVCRMNKTGVVGLLRGDQPGPTLMLRADMDALPIQEENDVSYKSLNPGVMHACGHDAHTAMLLVAAKILTNLKQQVPGNIKFVFEPNEENVGALAMIEEGLLDNPRVDGCLGLHIWTPLKIGQIGIAEGPVMAGMEHFKLVVQGRGGHTASPQSAIDPIITAAAIIQGVQSIQTREIDVLKEPTIIMFGRIQGGTASNVIPDSVALEGTMRYLFEGAPDSEDSPKKRFERVVSNICGAHRAEYELSFLYGHPTLVNHPEMAALVNAVAKRELDPAPEIVSHVSLAGEDFSEFAARVPAAFYFLGTGNPAKKTDFSHHHPRFNIDEDTLPLGVEMWVRSALNFFEKSGRLTFIKRR
ncbi:Amidohydrolase family protein [Olavius algarvensis Delta 1 endosymbiont]|nr:Amidohydrolase family protein [Olavius algarvensis Delta 1 endosymbiont]